MIFDGYWVNFVPLPDLCLSNSTPRRSEMRENLRSVNNTAANDEADQPIENNKIEDFMSRLFKFLGGRGFSLRKHGGISIYDLVNSFGNGRIGLFQKMVNQALKMGGYIRMTEKETCCFLSSFRNRVFKDVVFDHNKYRRPVSYKLELTDEEITALLCYYRDGQTFEFGTELTTELAKEIGLNSSFDLRRAIERQINRGRFNVMQCKGNAELTFYDALYCSFKEDTVKAAFSKPLEDAN